MLRWNEVILKSIHKKHKAIKMIRKLTIYTLVSLLLSVGSIAQARKVALENPDPISIPSDLEMPMLDKMVAGALVQKGWVNAPANALLPRVVVATYDDSRNHNIQVQIEYDAASLKFSYVDSENMNFADEDGQQYIHPKYAVWTRQLADQIKANIEQGAAYSYEQSLLDRPKLANPLPKLAFSTFSTFKLESATLAEAYQGNDGNLATRKNLEHNLGLTLKPLLEVWNKREENGPVLVIKPHIEAVRFIGTGARLFAGRMAGRSWIYVKVRYVDEATGEVVAEPELYRVATAANGFSLARRDYKMVEDMAVDIKRFTENNFSAAMGGGQVPPQKIRDQAKSLSE